MLRKSRFEELEVLVAQRGSPLLAAAVLLAGSHTAGEDLLQAALERVMRHWNRVHGDVEGLLRRTMYNLAVDTWRQRRRRPEVFVGVEPPGVPDPADTVALRQALVSSLAQLAPRQRAVLVLRYWEQLSEAEAAQVLGCSVGNIKSTASRGLARLREATAGWAIKDTPVSRGVHR